MKHEITINVPKGNSLSKLADRLGNAAGVLLMALLVTVGNHYITKELEGEKRCYTKQDIISATDATYKERADKLFWQKEYTKLLIQNQIK